MSNKYLDASGLNQYTNAIKNGVLVAGKSVDASTVGSHIVQEDVPNGAKFTDTTYKFTIGSTTKGDSTHGTDLGTLKSETATDGGTTLSLVTTGEKYIWNNKQDKVTFDGTYNASTNKAATVSTVTNAIKNAKFSIKGEGTEVASTTANSSSDSSVDFVAGSNVMIIPDSTNNTITISATDTTYVVATPSSSGTGGINGLMSATDKEKLDKIGSWALVQTKPTYSYDEVVYDVSIGSDNGNTAGIITINGQVPISVISLTGDVSSIDLAQGKFPEDGHSAHVILTAANACTVAIAHDATVRICPKGEDVSLSIPAGGYAEIDFLNAANKIFVRGV